VKVLVKQLRALKWKQPQQQTIPFVLIPSYITILYSLQVSLNLLATRSSAATDISVKILSTVETSPTTNPWKIEVMELKGYSWLTCSKQPWLIDCCIAIIHKLYHWRQEFCWRHDQLAMAKFSKSGVLDKVQEKSAVILGDTHISLQHRVSGIGGKKASIPKASLIYPVVFIQYRLVINRQMGGQTDRHTMTAYACANIALHVKHHWHQFTMM